MLGRWGLRWCDFPGHTLSTNTTIFSLIYIYIYSCCVLRFSTRPRSSISRCIIHFAYELSTIHSQVSTPKVSKGFHHLVVRPQAIGSAYYSNSHQPYCAQLYVGNHFNLCKYVYRCAGAHPYHVIVAGTMRSPSDASRQCCTVAS